ncbi:MAG: TIGR00159 family protein [Planctomycetes bacterium]|nr:TIGR00159 family protein [Planctomycetota bacterium]
MSVIEWHKLVEILIFWLGIYLILRSLRRTRGLGVLKGGVAFIVGIYLFSKLLETRGIEMSRLNFAIENLITVALIAFVIIFQPELRRGLTRLGEKPFSWLAGPAAGRSVSPIVEAAGHMSRRRIGALIAMERNVGIGGIIESGVPLSAEVTAPLLESIFYPNAPLHDGAVVVRGSRVVAARCLLPLSDSPELGPEVGTRHRAAVGLTEETDSIVVVVSEQTGRISLAHYGAIRPMRDMRELEDAITRILDGGRLEPVASERSAEHQEGKSGFWSKSGVLVDGERDSAAPAMIRDRAGAAGERTVRVERPVRDTARGRRRGGSWRSHAAGRPLQGRGAERADGCPRGFGGQGGRAGARVGEACCPGQGCCGLV